MAKYKYQFIVKKDSKKILDVEIEDKCTTINTNNIGKPDEALSNLRWIADSDSCEPNEYGGLRKHFSNIVRMFSDYGKVNERTKRAFDNVLNN